MLGREGLETRWSYGMGRHGESRGYAHKMSLNPKVSRGREVPSPGAERVYEPLWFVTVVSCCAVAGQRGHEDSRRRRPEEGTLGA